MVRTPRFSLIQSYRALLRLSSMVWRSQSAFIGRTTATSEANSELDMIRASRRLPLKFREAPPPEINTLPISPGRNRDEPS